MITLLLMTLATGALAQAPAGLTFEVASVKPAAPIALTPQALTSGKLRIGMTVVGTRVDIGYISLADLIRLAYDVKPYQISGPDWMAGARFDIAAKLPDGATKDQVNECLRALLADRFKLTLHHESKDRPIYALIVGKGGSKLKPSEPEVAETDAAAADAAKKDAPAPMLAVGGQSVTPTRDGMGAVLSGGPTGPIKVTMGPAGEHFEAQRMTLAAFADMLTPMVDRTVVDMTDLKGTYQLTFDVPLADLMAMASKVAAMSGISMPTLPPGIGGGSTGGASSAPSSADPTGASIFQSVQEMGLKLDGRQAPTDVIVIDHVEKAPTED
jgi:uncharacterized protein (TIGR03435 family)